MVKVRQELIPWDKSWIIRMGVLDLLNGKAQRTFAFLDMQENLGEDLLALRLAMECWIARSPVMVGESGTLYRFLQFASWKRKTGLKFIRSGTLQTRKICDDPNIINLPQRELLKLDNGTSQWASAAVLLGDKEELADATFKLKLTYDAVRHWKLFEASGWIPHRDQTIASQAEAFDVLCRHGHFAFKPQQAEDFCFALAFGAMDAKEGEKRWPSLRGHESDRITEIALAIAQANNGDVVTSCDHRVVQAVAMWCVFNNKSPIFAHTDAVDKSWPQFWVFLKQYY